LCTNHGLVVVVVVGTPIGAGGSLPPLVVVVVGTVVVVVGTVVVVVGTVVVVVGTSNDAAAKTAVRRGPDLTMNPPRPCRWSKEELSQHGPSWGPSFFCGEKRLWADQANYRWEA